MTYVLCLLLAATPGCGLGFRTDPESQARIEVRLQEARARGEITQAQFDAAIEALNTAPEGFNWEGLATTGLSVLFAALGIPVAVYGGTSAVHAATNRARRKATAVPKP